MQAMLDGQTVVDPALLQRMRGYMGLAVRAGQGVFGMEGCLRAVRTGEAALLLLDDTISPGSMEKYCAARKMSPVPWVRLPEGVLGGATGKPGVAMVLRSGGFADALLALLEAEHSGG